MGRTLRAMVVDDTITYRMIVKKVAESIPDVSVISTAPNGQVALSKVESEKPDVVLLDVEMPVMDGLTTLKTLRERNNPVTVVMVSGMSRSNANIVVECLNAGAMDFVTKPLETNADRAREALKGDLAPILREITYNLQRAAARETEAKTDEEPSKKASPSPASAKTPPRGRPGAVAPPSMPRPGVQTPRPSATQITRPKPGRVTPIGSVTRSPTPTPQAKPLSPARPPAVKAAPSAGAGKERPELLLIGSSTGGPAALARVLAKLGGPLPIPTLIVQHMPPVFTASLASQLSRSSGLNVQEAQEGMEAKPGSVILAMGGKHMVIKKVGAKVLVSLNEGPKVNECRPAVDMLFMSALSSFKGRILSVILTGMGRDGANGVDALKRGGKTYCITQSEKSCVVYGMPRSVEEKGLSDEAVDLDGIGERIADLCR
ncbi:MAG: chemotaxis-specific protein-glutamate methyltransferase CheB [Magnetococcales bacterium]|nr:chemotaxis-specific protein-glutamate methyltransferase CheB [Magnetococcales bacterium]